MESSEDKRYQPSQKKLSDARRKGEVPRSQEVGVALTYLAFVTTLSLFGGPILQEVVLYLSEFLDPIALLGGNRSELIVRNRVYGVVVEIIGTIAPVLLSASFLIIIMLALQRSIIFVSSNIKPKWKRVSFFAGVRRKFGTDGLFEFSKSFIKLLIYMITLIIFLIPLVGSISVASLLNPKIGILFIFEKSILLLLLATFISIIIAIIDYSWQVNQFIKKNMMSYQEIKEEHRESEGDPHFKSARRQRAIEIASNRMMQEVPNANVIIVNPSHYAIALGWNPLKHPAPIVLAKGVDEVALRIRSTGEDNCIPVFVDIPTARHLVATVAIGELIPSSHFEAVAAAVRFAQSAQQTR